MDSQTPEQLKNLARDPRIYDAMEKIGTDFDLHIDQVGELDTEVRKIILGLSKSSDLVDHIGKLLEVDSEKSKKIADAVALSLSEMIKISVNPEASTIASVPLAIPVTPAALEPNLSPLERVGDLRIERDSNKEAELADKNPVAPKDRTNILADLENPAPVMPRVAPRGPSIPAEPKSEPLVEQLLRVPTAIPEEKVTREPVKAESGRYKPFVPATPPSQPAPPTPAANDRYREPIT